jgi:acetoacetyl-CoA synthetase
VPWYRDPKRRTRAVPTVEHVTATVLSAGRELLWTPSEQRLDGARMARFLAWVNQNRANQNRTARLVGYDELWRWSVADLDGFWRAVWDWFAVTGTRGGTVVRDPAAPQPSWFPGASLNWAENVLRGGVDPTEPAVVGLGRDGSAESVLTWEEMAGRVAGVAAGLRAAGIAPGELVAAALPDGPEALVALLATAACGGVWVRHRPDRALARVLQLAPRVLFCTAETAGIAAALPSVAHTVRVDTGQFGAGPAAAEFAAVPFEHPLWVRAGGVQSHGGVLLEQLKMHGLHRDTGPGDRVLGCVTPAEPIWSALAVGATVLTCGGPAATPDALFRACAAQRVTRLDIGPRRLAACARAGAQPADRHDLSALRTIVTTAAPPRSAWRWVYTAVKRDVLLGVDLLDAETATVAVGTNPLLPLYAGELQAPTLGVAVEVEHGAVQTLTPVPARPSATSRWAGDARGSPLRERGAVTITPTPFGSYRVREPESSVNPLCLPEGPDHGHPGRSQRPHR